MPCIRKSVLVSFIAPLTTLFLLFMVEVLPFWTVNASRKQCENWLKKAILR